MIDFKPLDLNNKKLYEKYLFNTSTRGCEYSLANLCMWSHAQAAFLYDHLVLLSHYNGHFSYPFPLGTGDKLPVLDAIIKDAKERGSTCRIFGVQKAEEELLNQLYPGRFQFHYNRDSFDYVYSIDDLADLKGRKYHRKRNHLHRFFQSHPQYKVAPLTLANLPDVKRMVKAWYESKSQEENDFQLEQLALETAFSQYDEMAMEGLLLLDGDELLAFTMGSRLSFDTFDVHFEKARIDVDGAYTAINCEFAKYIREKYPDIRYLDREEDMGLEGLRKAKESYHPHHLYEKCTATLTEEKNDN